MRMDDCSLNFDPLMEDSKKLKGLSRRGFMGRLMGSMAAGVAVLSSGTSVFGAVEPPTLSSLARGAAPDDTAYWDKVADQFLLRAGLTYMNTGTRGPSPRSVHMAQMDALENVNSDYNRYSTSVYNRDFQDASRKKMADFLGAKPQEIAFTNNTTEGMVFGTQGIDLKPGDQIIFTNHDHSSGAHPCILRAEREKLDIKIIDLSNKMYHPPQSPDVLLKAFEAAITPKTKLLSFCHINYTDGCVLPVKEICAMARAKGIITLVDGAQPPGMMKLDLHDLGCDMYAGPCHKWMLASMYTGFFYVREDFVDRVWPTIYTGPTNGKTIYGPESEMDKKTNMERYPGAVKFERRGSSNYPARIAIDAAMDFHNHLTRESVEARNRYMAQKVRTAFRNIKGVEVYNSDDPRLSCALVAFTVRNVPPKILNALLWSRENIYIRDVQHKEINWDINRASMHVMVKDMQVDMLIGAVEDIAKEYVM